MSYFEVIGKGVREDADNVVGLSNPINAGRTTSYSKFYEIEPAIVTKVDVLGGSRKVWCVPLSNPKEIIAYPIDSHIKVVPIVNEVVLFVQYKSDFASGHRNYYIQTLDFLGNLVNDISEDTKARLRNNGVKIGNSFGKYFKKNNEVSRLLPFEGDVILEGRFGQSIRFGETLSNKINFTDSIYQDIINEANWMYGKNQGNPITIISNGRRLNSLGYSLEDINSDDGIIFMTSDSTVPFIPGNKDNILTYPKNYKNAPNKYEGNQVIIASDRLIFSSRNREMLFFANQDISFTTDKSVYVKSSENIEFEFDKTMNLGSKPKNKAVLGNELIKILNEILDLINNLYCGGYAVVPNTKTGILDIRFKLDKILSKKVNLE